MPPIIPSRFDLVPCRAPHEGGAVKRIKGIPINLPVGFVKESRTKMVADLKAVVGLQ